MTPLTERRGFTLIELLIVVAIIAILAAIAVPNFLEAQTRAKVSRAKADLRSLATAIESYRVDNNEYPQGTDNPSNYPVEFANFFGPLAPGYYTFRTRGNSNTIFVGRDFAGITTPISYITSIPKEPFAEGPASQFLTYCYRHAPNTKDGWILTSVGPDADLVAPAGVGTANAANALSTRYEADNGVNPARLGDISERAYIYFIEGDNPASFTYSDQDRANMFALLEDLTYDPTNGSVSDGDIWRQMGAPKPSLPTP